MKHLALIALAFGSASASLHGSDFQLADLQPFLKDYCIKCHGVDEPEAGIDLSETPTLGSLLQHRDIWESVLDQVLHEDMPPKKPYPSDDQRVAMVQWLESALNDVDWDRLSDPGRISLSRLTELEYKNSIRDIFGIDLQAGIYLGRDPEGNTGFTNDRDNLTFPLFAMQDFLREASRTADGYLGYLKPPFARSVEFEDAFRETSGSDTTLTPDGTAVISKGPPAFHLQIEVPYAGMYRLELDARTFDREPLSGLDIAINGRQIESLVIEGRENRSYSIIAHLPSGFSTLTFAFNADRAPLVQPMSDPLTVPESIAGPIRRRKPPTLPIPPELKNNNDAKKAVQRLNTVIRAFNQIRLVADELVQNGLTDFERHPFNDDSGSPAGSDKRIAFFGHTQVPFNLAAGKVALLMGIPQKELEAQLKKKHGYAHQDTKVAMDRYLAAFAAKHPDRVTKKAGFIALDRIRLTSHALRPSDTAPELLTTASPDRSGAEKLLPILAERAYRRPLSEPQKANLLGTYDDTFAETQSHEEALHDALVAMLISPAFLLRFVDAPEKSDAAHPVDDFELASRLASFLWLSIPDDTLRQMAADGRLRTEAGLDNALDHLIADPRLDAFTSAFTEQWMNTSILTGLDPNVTEAMRAEPALLLRQILREKRPVLDLIRADHTWLNGPLARHYRIPGVDGLEMRPVSLQTDQRGGLLGMGSMLVATSTETRTSPVMRGAWIVETLLGERLPEPPASVPELPNGNGAKTVREMLELHRAAPECAGCHAKIDPFGFVLENYDFLGAWRDTEAKKPVDTATTLEDGTPLTGLHDFKRYLLDHRADDFTRNMTERLLGFALGRRLHFYDEALIRDIVTQVKTDQYQLHTALRAIIRSSAFQKQNDGKRIEISE